MKGIRRSKKPSGAEKELIMYYRLELLELVTTGMKNGI
jgi:hypothetical protein